jgi:hypothetical protein
MTYPIADPVIQSRLAAAETDPLQLVDATGLLLFFRDEYVRTGYLHEYLVLLQRLEFIAGVQVRLSEHVPSFVAYVCYLDVLFAIVQTGMLVADSANYLTAADRSAQLNNIRSRLTEVGEVLDRLQIELGDEANDFEVFRHWRRHYRHEWHLNCAALARIHEHSPAQSLQELSALATEYEEAGDMVNASIAFEGVVDGLLEYCRVAPLAGEEHKDWMIQAVDKEAELLNALPAMANEVFVQMADTLVQANCFLDRLPTAKFWFERGIERLVALLAELQDPVERSLHLRLADDWLGLALQVEGLPAGQCGPLFIESFANIYLGSTPDIPARDFATVRAHISRCGTLLQYRSRAVHYVQQVNKAHDLFLALNKLYSAASDDLAEFYSSGGVPGDKAWQDAIDNLGDLLRLNDLGQCGVRVWNPARLLVETQGAGLHFPWMGLLRSAGCQSNSILVRNLQDTHRMPLELPTNEHRVLVLNCFEQGERLFPRLNWLSTTVGAAGVAYDRVNCSGKQEFVDSLTVHPYKLIVIGCHGEQSRVTEPLEIRVGGELVPVFELWEHVLLNVASTVVLFNCYGGGGLGLATGEFGSQAEEALNAGARAVLASRWPAWMNDTTARRFEALIVGLARLNSGASIWDIGTAGVSFVNSLRMCSIRDWANWSVYTSGCWVEP